MMLDSRLRVGIRKEGEKVQQARAQCAEWMDWQHGPDVPRWIDTRVGRGAPVHIFARLIDLGFRLQVTGFFGHAVAGTGEQGTKMLS